MRRFLSAGVKASNDDPCFERLGERTNGANVYGEMDLWGWRGLLSLPAGLGRWFRFVRHDVIYLLYGEVLFLWMQYSFASII